MRRNAEHLVEGYSSVAAIGQMTAGMLPTIPHELKRIKDELERMKAILFQRGLLVSVHFGPKKWTDTIILPQ